MKHILSFLLLCIGVTAFAQQDMSDGYQYKVDLNKISGDEMVVELIPPAGKYKELTFHLPKIVPGTYSIYDFGRFVTSFTAYDKKGKALKVDQPDDNTWVINKAKKLTKIVYTVEDTWDTTQDNPVFEPGGTNIEKELNFVFNNHGFFGFFKGLERKPFYLTVDRPKYFFGATSMDRIGGDEDTDIFKSRNYNTFVDDPIMFSKPDTAIIKVGRADVLIATYSPNKKVTSEYLKSEIGPILQAQRDYLGGKLPVDKYAFLIYLTDGFTASGGYGALEHSFSSMYVLPEMDPEQIAQTVRDVAAHEFFHIVTPLNIHSEQIEYFDFINPEMSQHLWLYEGVTEYSAGHVQVKQGLMPIENYLDVVAGKMRGADQFQDDLPFTEMSKGALDKYKDEYLNVYEKGALIGLCLDLTIRTETNGEKGIQDLMQDLSKEYGQSKPFVDADLFNVIESKTNKAVGEFLRTHVSGPVALPVKELMEQVGINYLETKTVKQKTVGGLQTALGFNGAEFFIQNEAALDDFGKAIGFKQDDVLKTWGGKELTIQTINEVLTDFFINSKEGDDLVIGITRGGEEVDLKTKVILVESEEKHGFELIEEATDEQLALRKAWLGDYRMA
ncbi:MAG: peptidase M61, partial [Bacteroidota bacterium]